MNTDEHQHIGDGSITIGVHPCSSVVPVPRVPVAIRPATMADVPFMDRLQKLHSKQLGYFPTKQFEGYVEMGAVLVAEATRGRWGDGEVGGEQTVSPLRPITPPPHPPISSPLGYVIARDRYLKRDELGVIYQLCVAPSAHRKLIGASLVKAVFDRSAYGCRLYCCWCAQDLAANRFWESLGFVPIAFRGGSDRKGRVHIFWQKRIRAGDAGERATPWWFPAKTDAGAMREDRLVLPIPPGLHWSDPMPVLAAAAAEGTKAPRPEGTKARPAPGDKAQPPAPTPRPRARVQFGPPPATVPVVVEQVKVGTRPAKAKPVREKTKCDPKLVAAARELRDRYLERVNADPSALAGPVGAKYDVGRALPEAAPVPQAMLPAA